MDASHLPVRMPGAIPARSLETAPSAVPPRTPWMQSERNVHPLLIALFPEVPPPQLDAMIDQARRTGRIAGPITVWRGFLVDGRARVRCAEKTGLPVDEIDISAMQEPSLLDVMLENNLFRRHLTAAQRALIAIETSQRAGRLNLRHITKERAAAASGISPSSLHALQYALTIAPELITPIRAGIISINRATEACHAMIDWPKPAREDLVVRLMQGDSAEAARLIRSLRSCPPAAGQQNEGAARATAVVAARDEQPAAHLTADDGVPIAAPAAIIVDPKPPLEIAEQATVSDVGTGFDPAALRAVLRDIARLRAALRELTALILRHPPTGSAVAELVTALRDAQSLDWAILQHELAEAADRLAVHVAGSRSMEVEASHGP